MEHKKDLGKLFKDRLTQVEAEPNTNLWDSIEKTLDEKRRKKRGFLLLWSGIVILLGVLFTAYHLNTNDPELKQSPEVEVPTIVGKPKSDEETKTKPVDINGAPNEVYNSNNITEPDNLENAESESTFTNDLNHNQKISSRKKDNFNIGKSTNGKNETVGKNHHELDTDLPLKKKKSLSPNEVAVANDAIDNRPHKENNGEFKNKKGLAKVVTEEILQNDSVSQKSTPPIKPKKKTSVEVKKLKKEDSRKMLISLQATPIYYDFISRGNPFENDATGGQVSGNISSAYGGLLNIPITEKMTFRLGFRKLNTRSTIKNVSSETSDSGNAAIFSSNAIARNGNSIPNDLLQSINNGGQFTIEQKASHSELPLEFIYTFGDKKLRLDAIGGISFQLLGKNSISIENSSGRAVIGSSNYLKKISFTPNIGLGIRYQLSDRVRLDLEPTLRYHFNAFEKGYKNQKPFILGAYTGLTIKL